MKAFPRKDAVEIDDKGRHLPQLGMDLRDYFAAHIIQGMYASPINVVDDYGIEVYDNQSLAIEAYKQADAMMEARNGNY